MHMEGDTILLEIHATDGSDKRASDASTFIGKVKLRWKHCLDEDKMNKWQNQQVALVDPENKGPKGAGMLSCQMNIKIRFQEAHLVKAPKPKYGEFAAAEVKHDLTEQQVGAAGTLHCQPI